MPATTTIDDVRLPWEKGGGEQDDLQLCVVIAWSLEEPERIGEIAALGDAHLLGRGGRRPEDRLPRLSFERRRPAGVEPRPPLTGQRLSRSQARFEVDKKGRARVTVLGRGPMLVNGTETTEAAIQPGDTINLRNALLLLVVERGAADPARSWSGTWRFAFGAPDPFGLVGESPAAWALRDRLAFAAAAPGHVLLVGESGAGKELAARAIHAMSSRAGRPLVARNAATFPETLVDAELFGTARNYPNSGSPERPGLIGEAHGSTLFLDEIGELPAALQAHLLRVLDRGGEYQRLGSAAVLRADLRLVAATNRPVASLKHDLAARLTLRVELPGLAERIEDVPLLIRYLLALAVKATPSLGERFFSRGEARLDPALVCLLLRHRYTHHLRELERLLWVALSSSPGDFVAATDEVRRSIQLSVEPGPALDRARIEEALAASGGSPTKAAQRLGLRNRFVLYRLMRQLGIRTSDD